MKTKKSLAIKRLQKAKETYGAVYVATVEQHVCWQLFLDSSIDKLDLPIAYKVSFCEPFNASSTSLLVGHIIVEGFHRHNRLYRSALECTCPNQVRSRLLKGSLGPLPWRPVASLSISLRTVRNFLRFQKPCCLVLTSKTKLLYYYTNKNRSPSPTNE